MTVLSTAALLDSLAGYRPGAGRVLRCLRLDDVPALTALYQRRLTWAKAQGLDPLHGIQAERLTATLSDQRRRQVLFAMDGQRGLQAAVSLGLAEPFWEAHPPRRDEPVVHLEQLVSDPEAPSGRGGMLLAAVEQLVAESGGALLRTSCPAGSRSLRRFWQTRHYMPLGEAEHPLGYRVLLHEKRLRPVPVAEVPVAFSDDALEAPFAGSRATLLFVVQDSRVLLIHKKRGLGAGKISGPGGKCEAGESPRACAIRETSEELCIDVAEPEYRGELRFLDTSFAPIHGFVFVSHDFSGRPVETDEARPEWFSLDALPFERMWSDDRIWLPWALEGEGFRAAFLGHDGYVEAVRFALGSGPEPTS